MERTKTAYTHVGPGLPPLHGDWAGALILGSFPSPKSREQGFFYGHPQNRFWPLMAGLEIIMFLAADSKSAFKVSW